MNRALSCSLVLVLLLTALAICINHTIETGGQMANFNFALLLSFEGVSAGALLGMAIALLRKRFARHKKPVTRRPIAEAAQA